MRVRLFFNTLIQAYLHCRFISIKVKYIEYATRPARSLLGIDSKRCYCGLLQRERIKASSRRIG